MTTIAVPARITIDFRGAIHPTRSWILGLDDSGRADLLAFEARPERRADSTPHRMQTIPADPVRARPTALTAPCACPDFCERDHANE